jgi:hypothetical protein
MRHAQLVLLLTCSNVDFPETQPGPDQVPSNDRQTFPSYSCNEYMLELGEESRTA